jgi:hypothetical protein
MSLNSMAPIPGFEKRSGTGGRGPMPILGAHLQNNSAVAFGLAPNQKHGIVKEQENIGPVFAVLRLVSWGKTMHHDFRQRWAEAKRQVQKGPLSQKAKK